MEMNTIFLCYLCDSFLSCFEFLVYFFSAALAPFLKPSTKLSKQALWISKVHLRISGQIEHFWLSPADFLAIFVTFSLDFKLIITISFRCDFTHTHLAPGGETSVFLIPTFDSPVIKPVERKGTSAMRTNLSSGFRTGNRLGFTVYKRTSPAFIQSAFVLPAFVQGDAPAWSEFLAVESGFCVIDVHAVSF